MTTLEVTAVTWCSVGVAYGVSYRWSEKDLPHNDVVQFPHAADISKKVGPSLLETY